ncbi:MAG TPA: S1C family serine protease [Pirellulales bacterium]|nr:S1C family serine protease [Pirellulales bacterium]
MKPYCLATFLLVLAAATAVAEQAKSTAAPRPVSFHAIVETVQPKIVKIYGAGGYRGLEPYQSGFLISPDGHVLTVWSYVLDTDYLSVTMNDGRKFDAKLLAADPRLELAVVKIEAEGLPYFDLAQAVTPAIGTRVLAFSNLFGVATGDEQASVQHGVVAIVSELEARRGAYDSPYRGQVYVLDAITNNPGAAGGALTDRNGRLLGMLGKELRNKLTNTWLNYALPAGAMQTTVEEIRAGRFVKRPTDDPHARPEHALSTELLGLVMIPEVMDHTPPYLDGVRANSPAAAAGLRPDDLVLFVNDHLVPSLRSLRSELEYVDRVDALRLTLMRGDDLLEITLKAEEP